MQIEFFERGNGYPQEGDILVDHEGWGKAYKVLPDIFGTGNIETHGLGMSNTTWLNIKEVDYDEFCANECAWEI